METRWQGRKALSSPILMNAPKSQITAEKKLITETGTNQERKHKEENRRWWEGYIHNIIKFPTALWATHTMKNNYVAEILPHK